MSDPGQMEAPQYIHLTPEGSLPELDGTPFRAILVIESEVSPEWEEKVCDWLVRSGCLYALTWGTSCSRWHDSIDLSNIRKFNFQDIPEDDFVMTTWHDKDSIWEAFWFCGHCAFHPTIELEKTYIMHIASEGRENDLLAKYEASQEETG